MSAHPSFDAIVVGSGITGGWAAKELTERGLKVLMLERGRHIEHIRDYTTEWVPPWAMTFRGFGDAQEFARDYPIWRNKFFLDEWTRNHFVKDREHPYQTSGEPFLWYRAYQLGGRSLVWGRQSQRLSEMDFAANASDGHGADWPIRYRDLAPWYDHVEDFIGVSGARDGLSQLPDGHFQPPMELNAVEKHFKAAIEKACPGRRLIIGRTANLTQPLEGQARSPCQYRNTCGRGCSFGAYFSTQSSTLPAARKTGNLTLMTDTLAECVEYDAKARRASGVQVRHRDGTHAIYRARLVFLCASTLNSVGLMLRSQCETFPNGLANSSDTLGRYLMDHVSGLAALGEFTGFQDRYYFGNRPNSVVMPRFRNVDGETSADFVRGYQYQGLAVRRGWHRGLYQAGIGARFKDRLRSPGEWALLLVAFGECLPQADNRVTLHPTATDADGLPQLNVHFKFSDNERKLAADAVAEARRMVELAGGRVAAVSTDPDPGGSAIHEMGGARMGRDPRTSVLNAYNQAHDVPNLFVTDGASMASSGCQNPSLTYMALTARACAYAAERWRSAAA
jgi:choline dehydrogenase-like flavoprotein